jgi:hypothetical protein
MKVYRHLIFIALGLIATSISSGPRCSVVAVTEEKGNDAINPLTLAVRAVDTEAYRAVKLEYLHSDDESQEQLHETEVRRLEANFRASLEIAQSSRDILPEDEHKIKVPRQMRHLWHTDPVVPACVGSYEQVPISYLTMRRRGLLQEPSIIPDSYNEDDLLTRIDEEMQETSLSVSSSDESLTDNGSHSKIQQERALQTCTRQGWKFNSCCGRCGMSFTESTNPNSALRTAISEYVNKSNKTDYGIMNCWNTTGVTNLGTIFKSSNIKDAYNTFNQDLRCWDVSKVTNFYRAFHSASSFNQDLSLWNMRSASTIQEMFKDTTKFNQDLCKWYCTMRATLFVSSYTSKVFESTQCPNNADPNYKTRASMCRTCASLQCPAAPVKPVQQPVTPTKPIPVLKPGGAPIVTKPTSTPVAPTSTSLDFFGTYHILGNTVSCYGQALLTNWRDVSNANFMWQQASLKPAPATFDTSTNKGTVSFPSSTTPVAFSYDVAKKQMTINGVNLERDQADCTTPSLAFDSTSTKWKVFGSSIVLKFIMCEHKKGLPGFRIYTGDGPVDQDPTTYILRGFTGDTWVEIHSGSLQLPSQRNAPGTPLINSFYYEVRYTCDTITCAIYDEYVLGLERAGAPAVHVGEIEFLYVYLAPTQKPLATTQPTNYPTQSPTKHPTKVPTSSPTFIPKWACQTPATTPKVCDNGLVPGDVVVTAFNTDDGSGAQTVVLLTSSQKLETGDSFFMTDRPLNCDASCNCDFLPLDQTFNDGTVKFTAPETILAGRSIAYSQFKKPFATKDVYFAWGKGQYCYYADAWTQVTWTDQNSPSQFHLYSYSRETDMTPYNILSGDNIFVYCMGGGKPVILFGLMLTDEINEEQGWTPYNRNLHSEFHNTVSATFKVASRKSHKPPDAPSIVLSPYEIPPIMDVMCTCSAPPAPYYLGCFKDSADRVLPFYKGQMSKDACIAACMAGGYHYAGLQGYSFCYCGSADTSLSDYEDMSYASLGPSTACVDCEAPGSFQGHWVQCVYKLPPTGPDFINNHFQCSDGDQGWCKANYDCLSPFKKGDWEDGCGIKGIAKQWEYRNNWRLKTPSYSDCKVQSSADLVNWVTEPSQWGFTKRDYDYPAITSQVVTNGFNFLCEPPPDQTDEVINVSERSIAHFQ